MIGTTLSHFKITAKLGAGGMGEVYRAEDLKLGREVAIKVLPPEMVKDPDRLRRFVQEAKSASALSHPYIVTIHEIGEAELESAEGAATAAPARVHYIAMELVDGGTLKDKIHREQIPFKQLMNWLAQAAEGLAKAHAAGIIHRDLKPDNIMITGDGFAKVLDFGLAKLTEPSTAGQAAPTGLSEETAVGAVLGTVGYMSPEQVQGLELDARSDIFSLGCILYEAATRQRPFSGATAVDTMHQILRAEPQSVRELSPETPSVVRRLIRRTLAKDPELRVQSMRDLAFELSDLAEEYDVLVARSDSQSLSTSGALTALPGPGRSRPLGWIGGAVAVVALAGAIAWLVSRPGPTTTPAAAPPQASFTQLTVAAGLQGAPALSPDAQFVVYVDASAARSDLFLLRVGGRNPINLTNTPESNEWTPSYSPDGRLVAFSSDREGGGVFVMGSTGESVRRLSDFGADPAFSPDGGTVAFASEGFADPNDRAQDSSLWTVSAGGGEPVKIYDGDAMQPSWSPNGRRLAFWAMRGDSGVRDLATVPAAGGEAAWITDDAALDWNPVWAADGWLYFGSDRGGSMNLWRVRLDEASGAPLGPPQAVTTPSRSLGRFSVSADGKQVVYTGQETSQSVERLGFDPATLDAAEAPEILIESGVEFTWASFSRDQQWLGMASWGHEEEIYVARADGTDLRQITDDEFKDRGPRWSPDSRSLVFYSNRSGTYQTWRLNRDGSGLEQLTALDQLYIWPMLSPDARRLVVSSSDLGAALVDVTGSLPATQVEPLPPLPEPGETFSVVVWSADGAHLVGVAYSTTIARNEAVVAYSLADRSYRTVFRSPTRRLQSLPQPLNDGRRVVFGVETAAGEFSLVVADLDGSEPRALVPLPRGLALSAVAPDDRSLLLLRTRAESDLWLASWAAPSQGP